MADLVTDLDIIKRLALEREKENLRFRHYLKFKSKWSDRRLDELVHQLAREISARIDCTQCANCCRVMGPGVTPADIKRLAGHLAISLEQFEQRYVSRDESGEKWMHQLPCLFLQGKLCSVYDLRPEECRGFPHLQRKDFRARTLQVIINAEDCPIVFNLLEKLKEFFWGANRAAANILPGEQ